MLDASYIFEDLNTIPTWTEILYEVNPRETVMHNLLCNIHAGPVYIL